MKQLIGGIAGALITGVAILGWNGHAASEETAWTDARVHGPAQLVSDRSATPGVTEDEAAPALRVTCEPGQRAVVRRAEGGMTVRLVQAEAERPRCAGVAQEREHVLQRAVGAVDIGSAVEVSVEDLAAGRDAALELGAVGGHQLDGMIDRVAHASDDSETRSARFRKGALAYVLDAAGARSGWR